MTPHQRPARSFRSPLLALLSLLTLSGSGCATVIVGPVVHGPPPELAHLARRTPVEAATVRADGQRATLTMRLRLDDGEVVEHDAHLEPELAAAPILVQLDTYRPEVGCLVAHVDAAGHVDASTTPLTADEVATHVVIVLPPERTGASVHVPGQLLARSSYGPPKRPAPLSSVRRGLHVVLLPVLVAVDVATFPIQLPVLFWLLRDLKGPLMT